MRNIRKQSVQVHRAEVWTATTLSPTLRSNLYKRTEQKQALAYPLSILKMSLLERGMEPVAYTGETSALFDVMPGDGQGEMRWPAIRSSENGVILKRGLYLAPRQ